MNDLTANEAARVEYLLKCDMARRMASIQEDRALNTSGRNVGNAETYVQDARALRKLLQSCPRQRYVPLHRMGTESSEWVSESVVDAADIDTIRDPLRVVCEKIHSVRSPALTPESMTDHDTVPGKPSG